MSFILVPINFSYATSYLYLYIRRNTLQDQYWY